MNNSINFHRKILLSISIVFLLFSCSQISAQQSISSAGGDGTGIGSFSYTIGQVVYTSTESISDNALIIQGVQIPFEIFDNVSCPTDFNLDGKTDGVDFGIFLGNFGLTCSGCPTDLNADGTTNGDDFGIFLGNFGLDCP